MHFARLSVLALFYLFINILAAPIESQPANPKVFEQAVQKVLDATIAYSNALQALKTSWTTSRNANELQVRSREAAINIERTGRAIKAAGDAGVAAMAKTESDSFSDAARLLGLVTSLATTSENAGKLLESMTSIIGEMGGLDSMIILLSDIDTTGITFATIMVSKMPALSRSTGQMYGTRVHQATERAIHALESEKQKRTSGTWWG